MGFIRYIVFPFMSFGTCDVKLCTWIDICMQYVSCSLIVYLLSRRPSAVKQTLWCAREVVREDARGGVRKDVREDVREGVRVITISRTWRQDGRMPVYLPAIRYIRRARRYLPRVIFSRSLIWELEVFGSEQERLFFSRA